MTIQINPSKIPIWSDTNNLQLGLETDSQRLEDLTNAQERLVNLLFRPVPDNQIEFLGQSVGLDVSETTALVELLKPSLLISSGQSEQITVDLRFAEMMRIAFDTGRVAEDVLTARATTSIVIEKLNRTGLMLIRALSEMGFRTFFTADYDLVARHDLGELSYELGDLGTSRVTAVRSLLGEFGTLQFETKKQNSALRVLTANHSISPARYRQLVQPHQVIEYGLQNIEISPVIQPGRTPCLGCRDLWKSESDPNWCNRSIQLSLRHDQLDDAAALLVATSLAAKNICDYVDGKSSGVGFEVDLKTRAFRQKNHQKHPACNCGV